MSNTTIIMAISFFSIFFTFLTYNYITTLVNTNVFINAENGETCIDFTKTMIMFQNPSFDIPKIEHLTNKKNVVPFPYTKEWEPVTKLGFTCTKSNLGLILSCKDNEGNPVDFDYQAECRDDNGFIECRSLNVTGDIEEYKQEANLPAIFAIGNFFIDIGNFLTGIIEKIVNFTGWLGGIIASFITIFTTPCTAILPLKYILGVFFIPMIIGIVYIILKMIPFVGGG